MAYAFVQGKLANAASATSVAITFTNSVVANNRIVSFADLTTVYASTFATTDNASGGSNSYTNDSDFNDAVALRSVIASANIARGGGVALQVTITITSAQALSCGIAEYSGLSTATGASAVDTTGTNFTNGANTTLTVSASPNPTAANEAAIAWFDDFAANAYTATSGTIRVQAGSQNGQNCFLDVASVVGTTTDTATVSANGGGDHENMVVYKLAAAGVFPSHAQGVGRKPRLLRRSLSAMALQTPTFPSTLPIRAIQKPPLRKRVSVVAVAPQTPTFVSTSVKAIQKPKLVKRQSIPVVALQTPTVIATSVRAVQKRPLRPLKPAYDPVATVGVSVNVPATLPIRAIQKPRLRPATSFAVTATQTPTVASTSTVAIQKQKVRLPIKSRPQLAPPTVTVTSLNTTAIQKKPLKPARSRSLSVGVLAGISSTSSKAIQKKPLKPLRPTTAGVATITLGIPSTTQQAKQKRPLKSLRPVPVALVASAIPTIPSTSTVAKQKSPLRKRQSISLGAPKGAPFIHKPIARATRVPTAQSSPKSLQKATRVPVSETRP